MKNLPTEEQFQEVTDLSERLYDKCNQLGIPLLTIHVSNVEERGEDVVVSMASSLCVGKNSDVPYPPSLYVAKKIVRHLDVQTSKAIARTMQAMEKQADDNDPLNTLLDRIMAMGGREE